MPLTGVKVNAYHCDAGAMANVVPNTDYRTFFFCAIVCGSCAVVVVLTVLLPYDAV